MKKLILALCALGIVLGLSMQAFAKTTFITDDTEENGAASE